MYRLYVIPGSHACRAAMLMLEHKGVPYRFLEDRHPDPPLFPADPERRSAVEEAERWANDKLQMAARRIVLPAMARDPVGFSRLTGDGRLGYLLYRRALTRRLVIPRLRGLFAASTRAERELLAELPATLDRIDALIADGVLGGAQLNVADFMVAPSLALILYRPDVLPLFEARPALELVDRLLPEPAHASEPKSAHELKALPTLGHSQARRRSRHRIYWKIVNPPTRMIAGFAPWWALLETTGRRTGTPRTTPLARGPLEGDAVWLISVHGRYADWVRNLEATSEVRIKLSGRWHRGCARVHEYDDTIVRRFNLYARSGPRTLGIDPALVQVQLRR